MKETPQQKYYQAHKDEPYFKLCQAVAQAKYRDSHRAEYNEYMREYKRNKKGIGQISTETGQGGTFVFQPMVPVGEMLTP